MKKGDGLLLIVLLTLEIMIIYIYTTYVLNDFPLKHPFGSIFFGTSHCREASRGLPPHVWCFSKTRKIVA